MDFPAPNPTEPIVIGADQASRWNQGPYEVWLLGGSCYINQGLTYARSQEAVLWIKRGGPSGDPQNQVIAYLEGKVRIDVSGAGDAERPAARPTSGLEDTSWLGEFRSTAPLRIGIANPGGEPKLKPAVYRNGLARRDPSAGQAIRRTQFTEFEGGPPQSDPLPGGVRRLRVYQRSAVKIQAEVFPNEARNEWVAVISNGVNLIIDGLEEVGSLDISTDRMVLWSTGAGQLDLSGQTLQGDDVPLEIYMEGNIVFRQQDRVIYAERMYYDVNNEIGTVLQAEVLTPVPTYNGLLRFKADLLQQTGRDRFFAQNTLVTSSRLSRPRYRLQARDIYFEDQQRPLVDPFSGNPQINPATGEQLVEHQRLATSRNNFLFLGPLPVFYWPTLATDLEEPTYFVRAAQLQNDRIFGTWGWVSLDSYELLGLDNPPAGTDWRVRFDGLSDRGLGGGTTFQYERPDLFGMPGGAFGGIDAWAVDDHGFDNLGLDRSRLAPEEVFRYRIRGQHRQQLRGDFQLSAEFGLTSDRNFLEQYFESEWDERKDQATGLELKRLADNMSWSVTGDVRLNDFFTQTEWLPRADHFWLGQPLLGNRLSWYEHSQAGFARLRTASTPTDPADAAKFALLPWEVDASGERFVTRQELDLPLELGPFKVVPYGLGELAHWGEDLSGDGTDRAYGQVGVRASIPFWAANPAIENALFNVHGIAHKLVFETDISYADANRDLGLLPLYDPLDDDAVEHFRRRFAFNTFGGTTPVRFDERFYALRTGLGGWVTSPAAEIADDLAAVRLGLRQRWQTKRGLVGQRRIMDWIVLDTSAAWFPEAARDNFGSDIGLVDYDFRWHVGDRLTLVSDGGFDFFDDGQRTVTLGGFLSRPPRGNWYLGFRSLGGPIHSHVVSTSYSYRLSPKWVSSAGSSYDFGGGGSIGQQVTLTRIGESFLASFAFNVDSGKDNIGASLLVEPRFLPTTRLGRVAGAQIPPAGLFGLE